jgi:riboflavin kinase/FMN adenylyltransferase
MAERTVVTIGTFDGVHLGHQAILAEVRRQSDAHGLSSVAYTFDLPPRRAGESDPARMLLLPPSVKLEWLGAHVDRVVRASFAEVQDRSPDSFIHDELVKRLAVHTLVVGETFRFGHRRVGDVRTLHALGRAIGFNVEAVPPVVVGDSPVSSTRIRETLAAGRVGEAADLLGRRPIVFGDIVTGDQLGETLGYPTANLAVDRRIVLPPDGVYLVRAVVEHESGSGLLYLGTRPTLNADDFRCEVHLLAPPDHDLYGRKMEVHLLERLRSDRAFSSLDALRGQITRDMEQARALLTRRPCSERPPGLG